MSFSGKVCNSKELQKPSKTTFGLPFNEEGILLTDSSSRRTIQLGDSETETKEKSRKLAGSNNR